MLKRWRYGGKIHLSISSGQKDNVTDDGYGTIAKVNRPPARLVVEPLEDTFPES